MSPVTYFRTGVGTYDVVDPATGNCVCQVQAEDGGWAVWVPESKPRPHHRLIAVRDTREQASQAGLAYLKAQGRT
jgi:hypothetical protein